MYCAMGEVFSCGIGQLLTCCGGQSAKILLDSVVFGLARDSAIQHLDWAWNVCSTSASCCTCCAAAVGAPDPLIAHTLLHRELPVGLWGLLLLPLTGEDPAVSSCSSSSHLTYFFR